MEIHKTHSQRPRSLFPIPGLLSLPVYPARVAGGVLCINPFAHKHRKNEQKKRGKGCARLGSVIVCRSWQ